MNIKSLVIVSWACLVASAAIAGEEQRTRIEIDIDDDASGHQTFRFDSEDSGVDLHDMAIGETRTITGESGETALVTRTEDGLTLEVNGETIDLGNLGIRHGAHDEKMVRKEKKIRMISSDDDGAITVISSKTIDESTRERIREVFESSGQDADVVFIDGNDFEMTSAQQAHDRREVRIIRKSQTD